MSSKSFEHNPFESSSKSMRACIHFSVTKGLSSDPDYQMVKKGKRLSVISNHNNDKIQSGDFDALKKEHLRKCDEMRANEQYEQLKSKLIDQDSTTSAFEVLRINLANMKISNDFRGFKKTSW